MAGPTDFSNNHCTSERYIISTSHGNSHGTRLPNRATTSLRRSFLNCIPFCGSKTHQCAPEEPEPHKVKIYRTLTVSTTSTTATHPASPRAKMANYPDQAEGRCITADPYHFPHNKTLSPSNTALIVIDMQRDFCEDGGYLTSQGYSIAATRAIIPNIQALLTTARQHAYPIFHTREGHRPTLSTLSSREHYRSRLNPEGLGIGSPGPMGRLLIRNEPGWQIIQELAPLESEEIVDKPGRSAFEHTELQLMLDIKGIKNLILCGVTTDVCVFSTMRSANDRRFDCLLVSDACAASSETLHEGTIESIKGESGIFGCVGDSTAVCEGLRKAAEMGV